MDYLKIKLKDCCISISDGDHQPPPKCDSGVPFITISNINQMNQIDFSKTMFVPEEYYDDLEEYRKVRRNDILYSVVGSFGKPVFIGDDKKFVFQRHIAILRPDEKVVDPRFLYYTLLNPLFYSKADKYAIGAAQRTLSLDSLRNLEIEIPSIDDQFRTVEYLEEITCKINTNTRINDNLYQFSMVT